MTHITATTSTATTSPARKNVAGNSKQWADLHGHWLMGCMRQVQLDSMNLYQNAWRKHGDYVRLRALPGFYFFLLAHPAAIEYVMQGNYKNYRKPDSFNRSASLLAGNGILTSEGEFWRKQRRLMQPAFLKGSVAKLSEHMASGLAEFVREWESQPDGRTLDAVPEMMRLALRIGSVTLVGTDISGEADAIGHAYRTAFEYVSLKMNARLLFSPLWMPTRRNREFLKAKALLDRVVLDLVAAAHAAGTA